MYDVFLEVIVNADEACAVGIESRDEIEDALEELFDEHAMGELTGGGGGMGEYVLDVQVQEQSFDEVLKLIKTCLRTLNLPQSTRIKRRSPTLVEYKIYD